MKEILTNRVFIVVILLFCVFGLGFCEFNKNRAAVDKAKGFLKEYRIAKALEVLNEINPKHRSSGLSFLLAYSYAKLREFDKVGEVLKETKEFPSGEKDKVMDFLNILSVNDEAKLLVQSFEKSKKVNLSEEYFITVSRKRNNIEDELKILEAGIQYLSGREKKKPNKKNIKIREIDEHLIKRYMDISRIFMGNQEHDKALEYLLKARKVKALEISKLKGEYYLQLGLAHKNLGQKDEAWKYLRLSSAEGNTRARDVINQMKRRFIPKRELLERHREKKERESKIEVIEEEGEFLDDEI